MIKKLPRVSIIYHNPALEDHLSDALCTCRIAEYDVLSNTLIIFCTHFMRKSARYFTILTLLNYTDACSFFLNARIQIWSSIDNLNPIRGPRYDHLHIFSKSSELQTEVFLRIIPCNKMCVI